MTPAEFEKYCFLRLYSIDLDTARKTLAVLKRYRRDDVRVSILRDVGVTYARPFSVNKGKSIAKHQLSVAHVPKAARGLHKELMDVRNSQLAHTDLEVYNPRVTRFGKPGAHWYPMAFRPFNATALLDRIGEIEQLVVAVEASVNAELCKMEERF